ncbi:MAG: hypothetical protein U0169_22600 [Polyangiaceae bacterium]
MLGAVVTRRLPRSFRSVFSPPIAAGILAATSVLACSASGEVSGGEARFDAAAPVAPVSDGGVKALANPDGGTTWTAVYEDYFKPGTVTGCSGDGACHGDANQPGAQNSAFVCNTDKGACRASLLGDSALVVAGDAENSILVKVELRQVGPAGEFGFMPKRPRAVFAPSDIARIKTWIAGGAKDD